MIRQRNPLLPAAAAIRLEAMASHPDAPPWDYVCGNRVEADDLAAVIAFRSELHRERRPRPAAPAPAIIAGLAARIPQTAGLRHLRERDLATDWDDLPACGRGELAADPGAFVPDDADWDRLICHHTSGSTGHALVVPHHPRACASYEPIYEEALAAWGVRPQFSPERAACFLLCAQRRTIRYHAVSAAWDHGLHAKLNLCAGDWPRPDSARRFLVAHDSVLYTGDPAAFAAFLAYADAGLRPQGLLSTATSLPPILAERLSAAYHCPAIDVYSLTETGPIAYRCRAGDHHIIPHDLHVEVLGPEGRSLPEGARGGIAVSGGRNPHLVLLRYRTGDQASLRRDACPCGDPRPRLCGLEGRAPVVFRDAKGQSLPAIDVSQALRRLPLLRHRLHQHADGSLEAAVEALPGAGAGLVDAVRRRLHQLFQGRDAMVSLVGSVDDAKWTTYQCDLGG